VPNSGKPEFGRGGERTEFGRANFESQGVDNMLVSLVLVIITVTLYFWLVLPHLRRLPWWHAGIAKLRAVLERASSRLRGLCGNSKTIAVAYAAELLGVLDEAKVLDWSQLLGADSAGRVMVIMGAVMILLRLVTRTAVNFKAQQ
jgi:hypothetical protein